MGYKTGQQIFPRASLPNPQGGLSMSATTWAYQPKPSLHGLSLRKSPMKNHNNIILSWVTIQIKQ